MADNQHAEIRDKELEGYPGAKGLYERYWEARQEYDFEELKQNLGRSEQMFREVRAHNPFSTIARKKYGGSGRDLEQSLQVVDVSAFLSLSFGIYVGINKALFLAPILKYGTEEVKKELIKPYFEKRRTGGIMMTEPAHGTDALGMETSFQESPDGYEISGTKHWQGLTGWASHWLVGARKERKRGLGRDIQLFICPDDIIEQQELYSNMGLQLLPYGKNKINGTIPERYRLRSDDGRGIRMLHDIFIRCRFSFPALGSGFIRRVYREAWRHCEQRTVRGQSLNEYGTVREDLGTIKAMQTLCEAMVADFVNNYKYYDEYYDRLIKGNTFKALTTDMMQTAADRFVQLSGAMGYRTDDRAGEGWADARGLRILEGANDVLYSQIGTKVIKQMEQRGLTNYRAFLEETDYISKYPDELDELLDLSLDEETPQPRRRVVGRITARLIALDLVYDLKQKGLGDAEVRNCSTYISRSVRSEMPLLDSSGAGLPDFETAHWQNFL